MDLSFCPQLAAVITKSGSSSPNNLLTLRALMLATRPATTLEIGLAHGASALTIASCHREFSGPAQQHTAIDPFQADWNDAGLAILEAAGLRGYVDYRRETSALALPALLRQGSRFGLIYVDGSHLFENAFIDAYYAARLLVDGGIMAIDDSTYPDVAKVLGFVRKNVPGLQQLDLTPYHPEGSSLWHAIATRMHRVQLTAFKRNGEIDRHWRTSMNAF